MRADAKRQLFTDTHAEDADVAEAVARALHLSACLPQKTIFVSVDNGHVTLRGEVTWEYQRAAATSVTRWLTGVSSVSNLLAVRSHAAHKMSMA